MKNLPTPPQILVVNQMEGAMVSSRQLPRSIAPLVRTKHLVEQALHERTDIERYSIEQLDEELQRQIRLIAEKGGVSPTEKFRLSSLMLDCMAELRAINIRLDAQLIEILLR